MARPISEDFVSAEYMRSNVRIDASSGCHVWIGGTKTANGYGVASRRGEARLAHRVAWVKSGRTLTPGLCLDHLCRNRACVNPDHLEEVTLRENLARGEAPSAKHIRQHETGFCGNGHELSVVGIRPYAGRRRCAECDRNRVRRYRARKRTQLTATEPDAKAEAVAELKAA